MTVTQTRPPQLTDWHLAGEAWIYVRRSSEEQKNQNIGSGLYQRSPVEYLKALGFPENRIRMADEDDGKTGTSTKNRLGFQSLVEGVKSGRVRVLVVSEVSRLGRDELDLAKFLWLCELHGVLLIENFIPRDLREIGDWTLIKLQAVLAEQENRRKVLRSEKARLEKVRKGIPVFRLPCGFEWVAR